MHLISFKNVKFDVTSPWHLTCRKLFLFDGYEHLVCEESNCSSEVLNFRYQLTTRSYVFSPSGILTFVTPSHLIQSAARNKCDGIVKV